MSMTWKLGAAVALAIPVAVAGDVLEFEPFGMDMMVGGVLTVDLIRGRWKWEVAKIG